MTDRFVCHNYGRNYEEAAGLKRILYDLIPPYVWHQLRFELRAIRVRLRAPQVRRAYADDRNLLVNVGAGSKGQSGWVNVDLYDEPGVNCLYDCRQSLPFADESVRGLFTEHFLEHLDYTHEAPRFLKACYRVLQKRGIIRVVVPDAEAYVRAYQEGWKQMAAVRNLDEEGVDRFLGHRYRCRMEMLNTLFSQGYEHKWQYDFTNLKLLLEEHGFEDVQRRTFGESARPGMAIDAPDRRRESLYVEATRP